MWKGNLMNHSTRLTLIKTTQSTMSVYVFISLGLPPWLLKALVKIMKAFLWMGTNIVQGGNVTSQNSYFGMKTIFLNKFNFLKRFLLI
jgi:hypothetical protein